MALRVVEHMQKANVDALALKILLTTLDVLKLAATDMDCPIESLKPEELAIWLKNCPKDRKFRPEG